MTHVTHHQMRKPGSKVESGDSFRSKEVQPYTQYNESEDRLFVFPPAEIRKSDRMIRVLMSR
jgi:hypothetical protein